MPARNDWHKRFNIITKVIVKILTALKYTVELYNINEM